MKRFYEIYLEAIAAQLLSDWREYSRTKAGGQLYRRNQDFVQWLGFQVFSRENRVVAGYAIQALAKQNDFPGATIVKRIRKRSGEEWWVTPDEWALDSDKVVEITLKQIFPDPYRPLDNKDILKMTSKSRLKSPGEFEMHGITLVVNNQLVKGKKYLKKAFDGYEILQQLAKLLNQ
ncbi:MAG TPA: hypothetical protein VH186_10645 [Chloroflexia bacterium]|nr:hypothetical protein [Chloroflexia bacterium]